MNYYPIIRTLNETSTEKLIVGATITVSDLWWCAESKDKEGLEAILDAAIGWQQRVHPEKDYFAARDFAVRFLDIMARAADKYKKNFEEKDPFEPISDDLARNALAEAMEEHKRDYDMGVIKPGPVRQFCRGIVDYHPEKARLN